MKRIVIAGGGISGTIVANRLARSLSEEIDKGEVEIQVIEKSDKHVYQPGQLLMSIGLSDSSELVREERQLLDRRIKFVNKEIEKIDVQNHLVKAGKDYPYDYLVIATGSHLQWDEIPGYRSVYSPWDFDSAIKLRETLESFTGGNIVINVAKLPHKCPVAPMEITLMLDDYLRKRGLREKTNIIYTYPVPGIFGIKTTNDVMIKIFEERGIQIISPFNVKEVHENVIESQEGDKVKFDLAIGVPPHTGAKVIGDSELGDRRNWVPTDKFTLRMKDHSDVYVIGDTTDLPISKAGSTADFESYVVAGNIENEIRGTKSKKMFDGSVFCYIATGLNSGTYIRFNYSSPPIPPPPSYVHWWGKLMYNKLYWTVTAKAIV
ncbi:NAD(P)/FAD-dependent oxidoreductase [Acidianus brierleyi]|uniref:Pyridine nucleotide-disulfide oxidoreductase n=1 Tax=Acidianus brierleyi TaxID=41673 RepID=A0A2U9IDY2_9CREN|nr:FAD/NAD(P)-binding oxidoreductase [Acidianus brierleyi]AWR94241.1 NAD(P)/FAD-dependent oxidoreductase [Acidianus brierleyi]